jgi:hypothetical protein
MKYNRIDIKMWLVSTSFKINIGILSNLYITYTIFNYNTISLRCSFVPVPVKGPSILSDCKFNSSAGEVSGTQAGLWGGLNRYIGTGPGEPRKGTWISEEPHLSIFGPFDYRTWITSPYYGKPLPCISSTAACCRQNNEKIILCLLL